MGDNRGGRKKTSMFQTRIYQMSIRNGPDPDSNLLGDLAKGSTFGYMSDFGKSPRSPPPYETKQRVYDEQRQFLGNYKDVVVKEDSLQNVTDGDLAEGLVSAPFSESEIMPKYHKSPLNSLGGRRSRYPDVRKLVDATQRGANQHVGLTMQPARPGLADSVRILDVLICPTGSKFDGGKAHALEGHRAGARTRSCFYHGAERFSPRIPYVSPSVKVGNG